MEIEFRKANLHDLSDCKEALMKSELGRQYYPSAASAVSSLTEGIEKGEIHVAVDEIGHAQGFIWFISCGAFHSCPYLHIIAVKEDSRGKGIGQALIKFYEETVCKGESKMFLVVADFNPRARKLYERLGYREVGSIPGLYKRGVTEYLMMKKKRRSI